MQAFPLPMITRLQYPEAWYDYGKLHALFCDVGECVQVLRRLPHVYKIRHE